YANISPLMDVIFGTYRCPDHEPEQLGIDEPVAHGYLGQILHPLLPRGLRKHIKWPISRKASSTAACARPTRAATPAGSAACAAGVSSWVTVRTCAGIRCSSPTLSPKASITLRPSSG